MRGIGTLEYLKGRPIKEFMDTIEEIIKIDEQHKQK